MILMLFTHQGINQAVPGYPVRYIRGLPYPARLVDMSEISKYSTGLGDPAELKRALTDYVLADWGMGPVQARIRLAADWATANNVKVMCTEFGAVRRYSLPAARYQWIADARKALDIYGIGWDLWDYTDLFGIAKLSGSTSADPRDGSIRLVDPEKGARDIDPEAIAALFPPN